MHFDDGSVDFPATANSTLWQFTHTFNAVGDFRYYCEIHGAANGVGMSGIVHVVAGPPSRHPAARPRRPRRAATRRVAARPPAPEIPPRRSRS